MGRLIIYLVCASALLVNESACAFNVDGYASGMDAKQVERQANQSGYQLRTVWEEADQVAYSAVRLNAKGEPTDVGPYFVTCNGGLIRYSHGIDFDADFTQLLEQFTHEHGNPSKVFVKRDAWTGPGGGMIPSAYLRWYFGQERIDLSFSPEGRTSAGALRYHCGASIDYASKNPCWPASGW